MTQKKLSSEVFYWDAPRKRLNKRDLFPLQIEILGNTYYVSQWTLKHFKVIDYTGKLFHKKALLVKPIVRFRDFKIQIEANATSLSYDKEKKELIGRFNYISEEHQELLKYFAEALESGDMVNIDNILRRVDMPVTPATTELAKPLSSRPAKIKRGIFTGLYLMIGAAVFLFTLATLYNSFFRIDVKTAFISAPIVPLQSDTQGVVKKVWVKKNDTISIGQPLISVYISNKEKVNNKVNKNTLNQKKESSTKNKNTFDRQISVRKIEIKADNANLKAAIATRKVKCNRRYKSQYELRNPKKSAVECDVARNKLTAARYRIKASKAALVKLEEDYRLYKKKNKSEKSQVKVENETLPELEIIYSHTAGKVIDIIQLESQYLKQGQTFAIIQKADSKKYIEAYLTKEEAEKLSVGNKAIVYSSLLKQDYPVLVEKLDYMTNLLSDQDQNPFKKSIPLSKTIKVILTFEENKADTDSKIEDLDYALPVEVSIERNSTIKTLLKKNFAGLINFFIQQGNAGSSLPKPSVSSESCKKTAKLFSENFFDALKKNHSNNQSKVGILGIDWKKTLLEKAKKLLDKKPQPQKQLRSSGITDAKSKVLKETRVALRDSQNAALLSLAYYITSEDAYLQQAKQYILEWAKTHKPTGHPIDETRLEGFLWAYDLLSCHFSTKQQEIVKEWLVAIQIKKHQWKFGTSSSKNNLRTHQLKILLMLDRLLNDEESLKQDLAQLELHAKTNFFKDGSSIDYKERDALHYHVFNLEPWLEIALLEFNYSEPVNQSFDFLAKQIKAENIHNQFVNSQQKIDKKREKGGFSYAKKGGTFDTKRITRSVISYSTLNHKKIAQSDLLKYLSKKKIKENLFPYIRYYLLSGSEDDAVE